MITSRKNDFIETMFLVIIERSTPGSIFYKILTINSSSWSVVVFRVLCIEHAPK